LIGVPEPDVDQRPHVIFLPYLPLREPVDIGPWVLSPIDAFGGPWLSARFEDLCHQFIAAFRGQGGETLPRPTIVTDRTDGCCGTSPTDDELVALRRAIEFAALDQNPARNEHNKTGSLAAMTAITTDNTALHVWPVDLADGFVAVETGLVVRTVAGGYQIDDKLAITPPQELRMPLGDMTLDSEIAGVLYEVIAGESDHVGADDAARIERTLGWLAKAWQNTPSITWEDRIVFLKTGFEALTSNGSTPGAATKLRSLFEQVIVGDLVDAVDHLLWSPNEPARWQRTDRNGTVLQGTDLEHWFWRMGNARNEVIHGGAASTLVYDEDDSAYKGHMFHTGKRLLREVVRVELARLGCGDLFVPLTVRKMADHVRRIQPVIS
jgi:hypothetical protein